MSDLGVVTSNIDTTLQFLRENNLLKDGKFCFQGNLWMSHNTDLSINDTYHVVLNRMSELTPFGCHSQPTWKYYICFPMVSVPKWLLVCSMVKQVETAYLLGTIFYRDMSRCLVDNPI